MTHPHNTIDDLILVLAAFLMVAGLSRILRSLFFRFRAWGWIFAAGIVVAVLGLIVWKESPFRDLSLVVACVSVDFISHGVSWVVLSHGARDGSSTAPKGVPTTPDAAGNGHASGDVPAHQPIETPGS